jgi:hypothetical protein
VCVGDQNELAMQKQEVQYIQKNNVGYAGYVVCVMCYVCVWCSAVSCSVEYFHPIIQPSCQPTKCVGGQAGRQAEEHWIGYASWDGMGWKGKMDYFRAKEKEKRKKKMRWTEKGKEREGKRKREKEGIGIHC